MQWSGNSHPRRYVALAEAILNRILDGTYLEGDRLPTEREISAEAGVSRSTAREAILALEIVGVVQVRHGEGTFVIRPVAPLSQLSSDITLQEPPQQLIEARTHVEPIIAGIVASQATPEKLQNLRSLVDEAESIIDDVSNLARFSQLGLEFHAELSRLCSNSLLAAFSLDLTNVARHPLWRLINQIAVRDKAAREKQLMEHQKIVREILSGESERASLAMRTHLVHLNTTVFQGTPAEVHNA